ncbi:3'-5' exonuclease [Arachnia propionica]|uniref:3'-5' exonuclease n=1 Tax=Arachnia propionica TaxID=1750 RepID=A0A3P1T2M2_9ACTN|nr:exonuclease domain-containing protein [Arachnia propionica]RRD03732.1 3'-5' exonuclease [Arachnia propionica]
MWSEARFVGFDTETSGRDPRTAEIVTAAVGEQEWLLRPTAPIPEEATAIHGITTEEATARGIDHLEGLVAIRDAIVGVWRDGGVLCVFNAPYDCTLLDRELRRHGLAGFEVEGVVIDPFVIDKQVDRYRRGRRQLVDVARHHGVALSAEEAHGALADARAASQLGRILAGHLIGPAEANAQQASWHEEQKVSYAEWLTDQGRVQQARQVRAETGWPLLSV